ncbi:NtaA/DmoA family FMN-dependent monooxygenase [Nakamurella leprariae]|uniref:NtaA/DmoA family FMN-dependent monooxygenase n=1 Tax=Nakamurella leprariae TaxID=2803911 RepID=A0A938YDF1_9ACTN|nr:NtaA/DmoA family FMN-dependent monooxygenase [Nakamurella leprariae]MBM9467794.1 NtaA/DmoA family FMN-dependent monooxygenase [Nakamurella leprariae]
MPAAPFHLGWFGSFSRGGFAGRWAGTAPEAWANGDYHIEMARHLERAGFDFMMFEDSAMVSDVYGGSMNTNLKYGSHGPKHDPMAVIPVIAKLTKHIGLIGTASTTFYPPFMLARTMATLSHLSGGRTGWNIVTSSEDKAAQNFGIDQLPPHDERYDRADEYVELMNRLLESWEPDAVVLDRETNTYVDGDKVHTIDFEGKYYKSRGPLNSLPPVGGRPVYCQAGSSPRGRRFAAQNADTTLVSLNGIEDMKQYRVDVHQHMRDAGRDPSSLKMMFIVAPVIADTVEEAHARAARSRPDVEEMLCTLSVLTEIDFAKYDLDAPLDMEMRTNGHAGYLNQFKQWASEGQTLRQVAESFSVSSMQLVGTPDSIAAQMDEAMQEIGGDGFLITGLGNRKNIIEVTEGLVPELQRRGLTRTEYTHDTLRENLMAF